MGSVQKQFIGGQCTEIVYRWAEYRKEVVGGSVQKKVVGGSVQKNVGG